jgi:hypothetical protein
LSCRDSRTVPCQVPPCHNSLTRIETSHARRDLPAITRLDAIDPTYLDCRTRPGPVATCTDGRTIPEPVTTCLDLTAIRDMHFPDKRGRACPDIRAPTCLTVTAAPYQDVTRLDGQDEPMTRRNEPRRATPTTRLPNHAPPGDAGAPRSMTASPFQTAPRHNAP